jgi:radical SAM superfamily enzyme YgiQ (UPF0313 family)
MRVMLAYKANSNGTDDSYSTLLPVGLCSLHAVLRNRGHQSILANLSCSDRQEIVRQLELFKPEIVGVSQFTHNRQESLDLAALAKKHNPGCFVVFGGPHATLAYRDILARHHEVDAVVLAEGEVTLPELLETLAVHGVAGLSRVRGIAFRNGAVVEVTPPREPVADLDLLPPVASSYDATIGVDIRRQLEFVITSRGCPAACSFCSSPSFWGKGLRFRSPRSIVDELKFIRDNYGVLYFSIRDDTFTADKGRVLEFCRLLLCEDLNILWNCQSRVNAVDEEMLQWMKRAGCECIQFGVESGSAVMLKILGKKITPEEIVKASAAVRKVGMHLSIYLITGIPGETAEDLRKSVELIRRIQPHDGQVSPLVYYPGTPLFAKAVREGKIPAELFEIDKGAALCVREDPFVQRAINTLLKTLEQVARESRFIQKDFRAQKLLLGYCPTTNVLAGERYEEMGEWNAAEREYREIVARDSKNPWGWLQLGELYGKRGDLDRGRNAFEQVLQLVPAHSPAVTALGELCLLAGDKRKAARWFKQALALNPYDETAREGLVESEK